MKRQIIITVILLITAVLITIVYFKNLNAPGQKTSKVMMNIPADAAVIFEFSNDKSFYDIFAGYQLFDAIIGKQQIEEMDTLRKALLMNPLVEPFLHDQHIFLSVHPQKNGPPALLFTLSAAKEFNPSLINQLSNQQTVNVVVKHLQIGGKSGYSIALKNLDKVFYLINKTDNVFCGSFSKALVEDAAVSNLKKREQKFILMPDRENANSLATLYINYSQLSPLFEHLFISKNTDIFRAFRMLPGVASLTLNYKTDALMFSGATTLIKNEPASYLTLVKRQSPTINHLKLLYPATTAYCTSVAVAQPAQFTSDLDNFQKNAGLQAEKSALFNKIHAETGINLKPEFDKLLGNGFAMITTRYQEKIAIIQVKNGLQLRPFMVNISTMLSDDVGQFKYEKLPYFLLGDPFNSIRKPYFRIIDNNLVLANSAAEIASYYDTYINNKFLTKVKEYERFDELVSEKTNVSFFIILKNARQILKAELKPEFSDAFEKNQPGWKNFYGASMQLSSANDNFYTNLCLQYIPADSVKR